ncbi:MAG: hypothetical protein ABIJ21_02340 [Nanoarchaeota archaeon]
MSDISDSINQENEPARLDESVKRPSKIKYFLGVREMDLDWIGTTIKTVYTGAYAIGSYYLLESLFEQAPRIVGPLLPIYIAASLAGLILTEQGIERGYRQIRNQPSSHNG